MGLTTFGAASVQQDQGTAEGLPGWLPDHARHYLAHIGAGVPIRALARGAGVHASTILRQVRRTESRRDDPLVDTALRNFEATLDLTIGAQALQDKRLMPSSPPSKTNADDTELLREAARILRRLCETGAVLAVAAEMEKAVVVRDSGSGKNTRTAVTGSDVAAMLAIKDWIATQDEGRIRRYAITSTGRAAMRNQLADIGLAKQSADDQAVCEDGLPPIAPRDRRRVRYGMAESPLIALSRRRDKDGTPFLDDEMVNAGERLREDFELSQVGPQTAQNWDRFLTAGVRGGAPGSGEGQLGTSGARDRVEAALTDLGPGLGDVVLRCCCYLEGLENAEKKLGWSARSGKIVLRIALIRLKRHYAENASAGGAMIG